jgi:hypothetical protein
VFASGFFDFKHLGGNCMNIYVAPSFDQFSPNRQCFEMMYSQDGKTTLLPER